MIESSGVSDDIEKNGGFHFRAVIDFVEVPGQKINIDPGVGRAPWNLEDALSQVDHAVFIDPASAMHSEKVVDSGHFRQGATGVFYLESLLKRTAIQAAVHGFVIPGQPSDKTGIEVV